MKKSLLFLFTFIVGISAYADSYLYIDDFPVYRNQLGTEIVVPVKAHFDARVSALQIDINCPDGLVFHTVETGADSFISYTDEDGSTCIAEPPFVYNNSTILAFTTYSIMGYWIPEGSTNYETYGSLKWEAGDYDEFFLFRFSVSENFIGGHITLTTVCHSLADPRGGTVNENGDAYVTFTKDCIVSITDEPLIEKTPAPVIDYTINDDDVTIASYGEGIVTLFVNGDEVNNPYVINRIFEDQTFSVFSYAQEVGKLISDTVYLSIVVPAKDGPEITDSPTISCNTTDEAVIITATGEGNVILYVDGLMVDNPHSITRTETDFYVTATATAQEEGKLISETTVMQIFIPPKEYNPDEKEYKIEKVWELNDLSFLNENDARQGFGMGGRFYINDKGTKTVYVVDQNGLTGTTYPGGANCGITRDDVGNIIVSNATFPYEWGDNATIKVINPLTNKVKEYIVPTDCGIEGRCDFIGFAYGDMMDGVGGLFLAGATTSGIVSLWVYDGKIAGYNNYCDWYSLTPSSSTVINHYRDLNDNSYLMYVSRNTPPVKIDLSSFGEKDDTSKDGSITLVDKGSINGVFPFIWGDKELFLYPTTPNYYDGFAISEAGAEPIVKVPATTAANANGYQCDWLNAEVNEDGSVSIYQYYPGGHITMYRLTDNSTPVSEKTATPEITYEITDEAVIITATGEGNVILYVDGLMVDNPYSVIRSETDYYVTATATAQEEGKLISEIASLRIKVPANENPLDENDWNILKSFYNQYSNGHFTWNLSDAVIAKKCEGVTVENLRVVAINLSSKNLEGGFPAMLLALDQLRTLDLSNNNLSGDAENQIAEYTSGHNISTDALHRLLINDNEFVGNVGSLASYFNNLEVLRVDGNHYNLVQPMVNPNVDLDLNNQSLDMDGNITNGIEMLSPALPSICLYDHNRQTFMTIVNLELVDVTQNPEWKMNIYMSNGEFNISSNSAYRGSNGQYLDGHTYLQSSWNNEQKLNLIFTFAPGDANFKGNVDITDLQAIVNYIFGDNNNKPFNYTAANLNNDNFVNVQDVVGEVNILLSTIPSKSGYYTRYMRETESIADYAQLYWEQGVLYLNTNKPVAAIDIVNEVNGDIEWNVANLGMVVMTSMCEKGEHAIIYSLDNAAFQPGVTPIATTTATVQSIYAAKLSDTDAELVSVTLNTEPAELNDLTIDSEVSCRLEGTCLVIKNGRNLSAVDIDIYAIDGKLVASKHIPLFNSGANRINLIDLIENNQFYIIDIRNGRQVIATQKITQIK